MPAHLTALAGQPLCQRGTVPPMDCESARPPAPGPLIDRPRRPVEELAGLRARRARLEQQWAALATGHAQEATHARQRVLLEFLALRPVAPHAPRRPAPARSPVADIRASLAPRQTPDLLNAGAEAALHALASDMQLCDAGIRTLEARLASAPGQAAPASQAGGAATAGELATVRLLLVQTQVQIAFLARRLDYWKSLHPDYWPLAQASVDREWVNRRLPSATSSLDDLAKELEQIRKQGLQAESSHLNGETHYTVNAPQGMLNLRRATHLEAELTRRFRQLAGDGAPLPACGIDALMNADPPDSDSSTDTDSDDT